jgi:isoleucyl-tRNA synthetase
MPANVLNWMRLMLKVTTDVVKPSACSTNYSQPLQVSRRCVRDSPRMWMRERNITQLLKLSEKINCAKQWREKIKKLKLTLRIFMLNLAIVDLSLKTLRRLTLLG